MMTHCWSLCACSMLRNVRVHNVHMHTHTHRHVFILMWKLAFEIVVLDVQMTQHIILNDCPWNNHVLVQTARDLQCRCQVIMPRCSGLDRWCTKVESENGSPWLTRWEYSSTIHPSCMHAQQGLGVHGHQARPCMSIRLVQAQTHTPTNACIASQQSPWACAFFASRKWSEHTPCSCTQP